MNAGDDQSDGGDDDAGGGGAPSEAFLSLQKELEEKETIQRENEERVKNQDRLAAEAARAAIEKVRIYAVRYTRRGRVDEDEGQQ